jgi:short subunit fatty acids transporter
MSHMGFLCWSVGLNASASLLTITNRNDKATNRIT